MNPLPAYTADVFLNDIFRILKSGATIAGDSSPLVHSPKALEEMQGRMYKEVVTRTAATGTAFQTYGECKKHFTNLAGDSMFNPMTGAGTWKDAQVYTQCTTPVMMGPWDMSAIYAQGGLPAVIIDKKTSALTQGGVDFVDVSGDKFWTDEKSVRLVEAANTTGFLATLFDIVRDAMIYGGAVAYPLLSTDNVFTLLDGEESLVIKKGSVKRWVSVDRWNCVSIPGYNPSAEDYLRPATLYYPLAGYAVHTDRTLMVRPKRLPYWVALHNIGWNPSDYSGYIRTYLAYQLIQMSVPIMAQQMSLLLYQLPLDALQATLGPEAVEKLMTINERKMEEWSVYQPKAVNLVGELVTVNRTFSGFADFIGAVKSDLAAQCDVPEPALFHTPNKGFSDNTQEMLLKQSASTQFRRSMLEEELPRATSVLIAHVFGQDSPEWKNRATCRMKLRIPEEQTGAELAESGARFAASVASLSTAGVPADIAIKLAQQYHPLVRVSVAEYKDIADAWKKQQETQAQKANKPSSGGHSPASTGGNTGWGTK